MLDVAQVGSRIPDVGASLATGQDTDTIHINNTPYAQYTHGTLSVTKTMIRALCFLALCSSLWGQCAGSWGPAGQFPGATPTWLGTADLGAGPELYAAAGGQLYRWNGAAWISIGPSVNGAILDATSYSDGLGSSASLYVVGTFTHAGIVQANRIARWDGSSWHPVGGGIPGPSPVALSVYDDGGGPALFVGGQFTSVGGLAVSGIARWNGSSWADVGGGLGGGCCVHSMTVHDDGSGEALYVGGSWFASAGGTSVNSIARWDGQSWSDVGAPVFTSSCPFGVPAIDALTVHDDGAGPSLYVGGQFVLATGNGTALGVARWDGATWSSLNSGPIDGDVISLASYEGELYIGGGFQNVGAPGTIAANHIARWNGSSWSPCGSGLNTGFGMSMAVHDDGTGPALFVADALNLAGAIPVSGVARWSCGALNNPTLSVSQPAGTPGSPILVVNTGLVPGHQYYNVFSVTPAPGGLGTGPWLGLHAPDPTFLLWQVSLPVGAVPFHFAASATSASFGPYMLPATVAEGVCFDYTNGVLGQVSAVGTYAVQ